MKPEHDGASRFEELRDLHPDWAEGRRTCPVQDQFGRASTRVLGYEDVENVLRDPETFSSRITTEARVSLAAMDRR